MSLDSSEISKNFNWKRILISIVIGLSVAGYLLYSNLTEVRYQKVEFGTGSYSWQDTNGNEKVDLTDENEFILSEKGEYKKNSYKDVLASVNWTTYTILWLLLACLMMVLRDVFYMIRIRVLTDKKLSWKQSFRVIMMWEFASALTPGVVGGAAVAMFILKREKIPLGKSTAIVVITALMDNLFYIISIPIILLFVGANEFFPVGTKTFLGFDLNLASLFWFAYAMVVLLATFLVLGIFVWPHFFKKILSVLFSLPLLKRWKHKALKTGDDIILASKEFKSKNVSFWLKTFGATYGSWTSRFLVINCVIMAFVNTGLHEHFLIYARELGMWIIMIISPTPGGSGIAEYAFTEFLWMYIPVGASGLLAIVWRLISYYPYLIIGPLIMPKWLKSK